MNKRLHFSKELVTLVLSGKKNSTWRLWDDKNLSIGDIVDFLESKNEKLFVTVKITDVIEKKMGELREEDKQGHEKFKDDEEMYKTYSRYYKREVNSNTVVKIIRFDFI